MSAVAAIEGLDADRVHDLGHFLATRAADREMVKLGAPMEILDLGGGMGVDYDGSGPARPGRRWRSR